MSKENVGIRIRKLRENHELGLEQLAQRSGLAVDILAALEESSTPPSLGPLLKVARILGVRLGTFLDDQVSQDPLIVRLDERQAGLNMHHGANSPVALRFFPLGQGKTDRRMEPFSIQVLPESSVEKPLSSHEGEEFIVVFSGEIEVIYRDFCRGRIARYKIPKYIACVDSYPMTASGKIQKYKLRETAGKLFPEAMR